MNRWEYLYVGCLILAAPAFTINLLLALTGQRPWTGWSTLHLAGIVVVMVANRVVPAGVWGSR